MTTRRRLLHPAARPAGRCDELRDAAWAAPVAGGEGRAGGRAVPGHESDDARRRAWAVIDGKLALLEERIVTARVVEPPSEEPDEVRFGMRVSSASAQGRSTGVERDLTIVGVDEASVKDGRDQLHRAHRPCPDGKGWGGGHFIRWGAASSAWRCWRSPTVRLSARPTSARR